MSELNDRLMAEMAEENGQLRIENARLEAALVEANERNRELGLWLSDFKALRDMLDKIQWADVDPYRRMCPECWNEWSKDLPVRDWVHADDCALAALLEKTRGVESGTL